VNVGGAGAIRELRHEIAIMSHMHHPRVVQVSGEERPTLAAADGGRRMREILPLVVYLRTQTRSRLATSTRVAVLGRVHAEPALAYHVRVHARRRPLDSTR